jgi:hypothetical protein
MTTIPFIKPKQLCSFCKAEVKTGQLALVNPDKTRYMCISCIKHAMQRLKEEAAVENNALQTDNA